MIIKLVNNQGFHFVTLSQVVRETSYELGNNGSELVVIYNVHWHVITKGHSHVVEFETLTKDGRFERLRFVSFFLFIDNRINFLFD